MSIKLRVLVSNVDKLPADTHDWKRNVQTSCCARLFYTIVLQTISGMGMGMNVTAHQRQGRYVSYQLPRDTASRLSARRFPTSDPAKIESPISETRSKDCVAHDVCRASACGHVRRVSALG